MGALQYRASPGILLLGIENIGEPNYSVASSRWL